MATIRREVPLSVTAEAAWARLRDFGAAGRLFAGVLIDCRRQGDRRTVTFANGRVVSEQLVTLDDEARRLVYVVLDGPFTQHSAAMEIRPDGSESRFVWTSDFLPDAVSEDVAPLVNAGCEALARNLSAAAAR